MKLPSGKELQFDPEARAEAKKRVNDAEIVFTTCIGSAIGLLHVQVYQIIIVDEASQQREPASIVPLIKGCSKAILVGDHVQLGLTASQYPSGFDVSLLERLYTRGRTAAEGTLPDAAGGDEPNTVSRLMLDTQYRMHPQVSAFSSGDFYGGKLKTGIGAEKRPFSRRGFSGHNRGLQIMSGRSSWSVT